MKKTSRKNRSGLTLIEIMVAITVIIVGVLGAVMYRYSSALHARKADVHAGAGRVALLILEGWKGAAGNPAYDPSSDIGLEVLNSDDIDISASGGVYTVQLLGGTETSYYAELLPPTDYFDADLDGDGTAETNDIRKLEVVVTYYGSGSQDASQPAKAVKISGFVRTY